jgi:hypothetical protein
MSGAEIGEVSEPAMAIVGEAACKWRPSGEFAMVYPSGWSIARYSVYEQRRYLLWEPINRCPAANANQFHGPNDHVRDAMRLHRDLTAHLQQQETAA